MKYAIEMDSAGMVYVPRVIKIDSDIEEIRFLQQQFEWLQCWYCRWEGFQKYAVEMGSGVMM
jgi:hypothetical protein